MQPAHTTRIAATAMRFIVSNTARGPAWFPCAAGYLCRSDRAQEAGEEPPWARRGNSLTQVHRIQKAVRVVCAGLTLVVLGFTFAPQELPSPEGTVLFGVVFAASLGLLAVVPTWRGLLLATALFLAGTTLLPPAAEDPDPQATNRGALAVSAFLTLWAAWTSITRRAGWSTPFGIRPGAVLWSWGVYLVAGGVTCVGFWASGRMPSGAAWDSPEMTGYWLGQPELTIATTTSLLAAMVAGFVSAKRAGTRFLMHSAVSSAIHLLWLTTPAGYPAVYTWGNMLGSIAATLLGGYVYSRRVRRTHTLSIEPT